MSKNKLYNYISNLIRDNSIKTTIPIREKDIKSKKEKISPKQKFKKISVYKTYSKNKNIFKSISILHKYLKELDHTKAV